MTGRPGIDGGTPPRPSCRDMPAPVITDDFRHRAADAGLMESQNTDHANRCTPGKHGRPAAKSPECK